jgi:saccharopine dehydrogenase-like NADP-dependent oxidoreductase
LHYATEGQEALGQREQVKEGMNEKRNVLIIGASGGVARAFLRRIAGERKSLGKLVLVDRDGSLLTDPYIPQDGLDYEFVKADIDEKNHRRSYEDLLHRHGIGVVIDLSVNETRSILEVTDENGVSYINTGIANRIGESFFEVVRDVADKRTLDTWRVPHILCAGMNPGIVNMWVRKGVERFGLPKGVVHFEYDQAQPHEGWLPLVTWSKETFVDEVNNDPAGYMESKGKVKYFYPNPLKNRVPMTEVLRPVMALKEYPKGFLLLHEENITIAQKYNIPSRFLFAVHPRTMDHLEALYDEHRKVSVEMVTLGDNRGVPLKGMVTIGVLLEYSDRKVYFFNTTRHESLPWVSGSCWQVAAGLHAALFTLLDDSLQNRVYFVEDLFGTSCERLMVENLPVQELIVD